MSGENAVVRGELVEGKSVEWILRGLASGKRLFIDQHHLKPGVIDGISGYFYTGSYPSFATEVNHVGTEGAEAEVSAPAIEEGESCFRVPVALWEKVQRKADEADGHEQNYLQMLKRINQLVEESDGHFHACERLGVERKEALEGLERTKLALNTTREERDAAIAERDALKAELEKEYVFKQARNSSYQLSLRGMPVKLKETLDSLDYHHDAIKRLMAEKEEMQQTLNSFLRSHQEAEAKRTAAMMQIPEEEKVVPLVPVFRHPSVDSDKAAGLELVLKAVEHEVKAAREKHARFNSAHEGYAVILEELDELKSEVWKKREERDKARMQDEAVQVAAMAVRFLLDVI